MARFSEPKARRVAETELREGEMLGNYQSGNRQTGFVYPVIVFYPGIGNRKVATITVLPGGKVTREDHDPR